MKNNKAFLWSITFLLLGLVSYVEDVSLEITNEYTGRVLWFGLKTAPRRCGERVGKIPKVR